MSKAKSICFASVVSELQQSQMFMTVKARILETQKANLNGCRVTDAFVNEIVGNEEKYVGLPLYADFKALKGGRYDRLSHLYDKRTGEFYSTQIGSFYRFETEETKDGTNFLIGYARLPKRNADISKAIAELFASESLKFSFEITAGDFVELEDGTFEIDASENNFLEGTAIVTFPACEDAVALEFVAQREADDTRKGDEEMADVEKLVAEETEATEVAEATEEVTEVAETTEQPAEAEETAQEEQQAEEENAACKKRSEEEPEEENAACKERSEEDTEEQNAACKKKADEEVAQLYVNETTTEAHETSVYDTETGVNAHQEVVVRTTVSREVEGNLVETEDGVHVAEAPDNGETEGGAEPSEEPSGEEPSGEGSSGDPEVDETTPYTEDSKKTAEQMIAELTDFNKNLANEIKALAEEIRNLKEQHFTASQKVTAEINPFTDTIRTQGAKYSLLEPESKVERFTLV